MTTWIGYFAPMYVLHYAPDNASVIVRVALEELGVPYRTALVDRASGAQRGAAYRALNPNGLIPALETPHGVLFETGAILLWLADTHGRLAPLPADPARGTLLKWLFFVSNTPHAELRRLFYPGQFTGPDPAAQAAMLGEVRQNLLRHFAVLETHWTAPEAPDMLSIYIAFCLRWAAIYGPNDRAWFRLDGTPTLRDMGRRLEARDSVLAVARAEGLGPAPFTAPQRPNPPEGSAL